MKPCPSCGEQPTVEIRAPEAYEFVGSVHIDCCDHHACGDGMSDATEAWEQGPRVLRVGEITSL